MLGAGLGHLWPRRRERRAARGTAGGRHAASRRFKQTEKRQSPEEEPFGRRKGCRREPTARARETAKTEPQNPKPAPESSPATKPAQPAARELRPIDVRRSLYTVLSKRDAEKRRYFRLGTAWAVAPRCLVTSGAVIMAIEELQQSDLRVRVSPAGEMQELRVVGMRVHPIYRQAAQGCSQRLHKEPRKPPLLAEAEAAQWGL